MILKSFREIYFFDKIKDETILVVTNFEKVGETLKLDKLHISGSSSEKVGRPALWEIAKDIGKQFEAKEIVIQGGRKTTGKYKGKVPSPVIIKVD